MKRASAAGLAFAAATLATVAWWVETRPFSPAPLPDLTAQLAGSRPLSADPGLQLAPRFSPDGRQLAYALAEGGEARIVVQALDGSSRRFIAGAGTVRLSPVFFPGGRRIAYWTGSEDDCGLVEHDLETAAERELLDCSLGPHARFDVAPDGASIVFAAAAQAERAAGLWLLRLQPRSLERLTSSPSGAGDVHPRFSPDGRHVAFLRGPEGRRQPWILDPSSPREARAVATAEGQAHGVAWMGIDGPLIVSADWTGAPALHLLDLRDGRQRPAGGLHGRFPDRSPLGDLVYENVTPGEASNPGVGRGYAEARYAAPRAARVDLKIARR